jgi:hypothetical protein
MDVLVELILSSIFLLIYLISSTSLENLSLFMFSYLFIFSSASFFNFFIYSCSFWFSLLITSFRLSAVLFILSTTIRSLFSISVRISFNFLSRSRSLSCNYCWLIFRSSRSYFLNVAFARSSSRCSWPIHMASVSNMLLISLLLSAALMLHLCKTSWAFWAVLMCLFQQNITRVSLKLWAL